MRIFFAVALGMRAISASNALPGQIGSAEIPEVSGDSLEDKAESLVSAVENDLIQRAQAVIDRIEAYSERVHVDKVIDDFQVFARFAMNRLYLDLDTINNRSPPELYGRAMAEHGIQLARLEEVRKCVADVKTHVALADDAAFRELVKPANLDEGLDHAKQALQEAEVSFKRFEGVCPKGIVDSGRARLKSIGSVRVLQVIERIIGELDKTELPEEFVKIGRVGVSDISKIGRELGLSAYTAWVVPAVDRYVSVRTQSRSAKKEDHESQSTVAHNLRTHV